MGVDKASLPFGPEAMLQRVVRLVSQCVPNTQIVVVSGTEQTLPDLHRNIRIVQDRTAERGPLEGISVGLKELESQADAIAIVTCDVPLLVPAFVERLFSWLGDFDAVVPCDTTHVHPLSGVYRPAVRSRVDQMLDSNQLKVRSLLERIRTREISTHEFLDVDPELWSLRNLNHPDEYERALASAGFVAPNDSHAT